MIHGALRSLFTTFIKPAGIWLVATIMPLQFAIEVASTPGSDAVHFAGEVDRARAAAGEDWRHVSVSVDFAAGAVIAELQGVAP